MTRELGNERVSNQRAIAKRIRGCCARHCRQAACCKFTRPQIGNNQPGPKTWSHSWKMFAVWAACNLGRARGAARSRSQHDRPFHGRLHRQRPPASVFTDSRSTTLNLISDRVLLQLINSSVFSRFNDSIHNSEPTRSFFLMGGSPWSGRSLIHY